MSAREAYDPGVPCWVETIQPNTDAAADFYGSLFGWELVGPGPGAASDDYRVARLRGRDVAGIVPLPPMISPPPSPGWITHVRVDSARQAAERAQAAGGRLIQEHDAAPAGRLAVLADPAGAVFCAWEPELREGAQLVNEPGAWAMSRLDTPDPEGAAAFYGEVFGWTAETFAMGEETFWLFRLPGYVGGEPEQPVSREVIAAMGPAPDGASPGWSVDFWVDDVDATAATAAELGGGTLVAPTDIPIGRTAVLADPAGASFSVSRVVPPAG